MSYYTGTFLVGAHWFGVPFPKLQIFSEIFWVLPIDYNLVFTNSPVEVQDIIFVNEPFLHKMLVLFLALIFLYTLKKIPWKNFVMFWKWNLKTCSSVGLKLIFEKIKFKVFYCIQHDFICQHLGSAANRYFSAHHHEQKNKKPLVKLSFRQSQ